MNDDEWKARGQIWFVVLADGRLQEWVLVNDGYGFSAECWTERLLGRKYNDARGYAAGAETPRQAIVYATANLIGRNYPETTMTGEIVAIFPSSTETTTKP